MTRFSHTAPAVLLVLCGAVNSKQGSCPREQEGSPPVASEEDSVSFMQVALSAARRGSKDDRAISSDSTEAHVREDVSTGLQQCSDLANKGAYFTVSVGIGTPEQYFNLVADTGSDALIIPDCRCVKSGYCDTLAAESCFTAGNSTSFGLDIKPSKNAKSLAVMGAKMNYGSGQIQVLVASEHVKVAGIHTKLHNGVFLMEDRRSLKVHGDFEGILGLGLPHHSPLTKEGIKIPAFMESSGVNKYQVCFNEWPQNGALRLGTALPHPMTNIGSVHWGLDLQGFSVGDAKTPAIFCRPDKKDKAADTACGAIPDSGTTLMMGPAEHIRKLYSHICDHWPRCKKSAEKAREDKDKAFHEMLYSCESWMTEDQGVNEIPSIFVHLAGAEGQPQTVELSAWSYIVETTQEIYKVVTSKLFGIMPVSAAIDTGKKKKICTASFGPQEYHTVKNGPVWIMGAPVFYATTVGYDLGGKDEKPKISFMEGPCTLCNETASLLSVKRGGLAKQPPQRRLRQLSGPIMDPGIDVSRPL